MPLPDFASITDTESRSINAENPTGARGSAGSAASALGPGRKGRAFIPLASGDSAVLAEIDGPGVIRHIWITVPDRTPAGPFVLRDLVLRMFWDGETHPSVEVPVGDFFCNGFGTRALVTSTPIVVAPTGGMNCYFPMPFRRSARITLTSEHPADLEAVFFQIDYSRGDQVGEDAGRFHAQWRRSRPSLGEDHIILDGVVGSGAYVGTFIALTALGRFWWGEGEVKFFLDGDGPLPTIAGTGLEDYVGGAWAFQDRLDRVAEPEVQSYSGPYFGYPQRETIDRTRHSPYSTAMPPMHGLYRWHLPDPIRFRRDLRVTLQQIGHDGSQLFERADDIATTAYWYQGEPHMQFPTLPAADARRPL